MVDPEGLRHFPTNLYAGGGIECSMAHTFMPASVFSAANGITFRVGPLPDEPVRGSMQTGEFRHGDVRVWVSGMPAGANGEAMVDREVLRTLSLNGHMNALIHYIDYHGTGQAFPGCYGRWEAPRWQPR